MKQFFLFILIVGIAGAWMMSSVSKPGEPAIPTTSGSAATAFVESLTNGQAGVVVGVYSDGRFYLPVTQQPANNPNDVTTKQGETSQYRAPSAYGTIGILAHNYLSGLEFFELHDGDDVSIVYGDGQTVHYRVDRIERYQALSPTSEFSDFIDLETGEKLTAGGLFNRIYATGNRLVLQTCIDSYGDPSWGRIFVVAEPYIN